MADIAHTQPTMPTTSKRDFVKSLATGGAFALLPFPALERLMSSVRDRSPVDLARDDEFWDAMRRSYSVTPDFIQLENGYFSLASDQVLEHYITHIRRVNATSSFYMRTQQAQDKLKSCAEVARLLGCTPDEMIITRNTTESLDTVIAGYDWKNGDEAIMAVNDYGSMVEMFKLQARRYGMVNKLVKVPLHPKSDEEIVQTYEAAITPRTRVMMVCHMINVTGHVLPVAKIVEMAHRHNVEVMVDGAHAFGQLDFKIGDLGGCDYYASSLHKWLGTPLGAGLLYVRRDRISKLWPIYADGGFPDNDIRKLNHTGTHPVATDLAIQDAVRFHDMVGIRRKSERLQFLQRYWTDKVRSNPNIVLNTPAEPARTGAIANVGVKNMMPGDLARTLLDKYKIFTVAINDNGVIGVRVTPQVFTSTAELDQFVKALTEIAA